MNVVAEQLRRYAESVVTTGKDMFTGIENMPRVPVVVVDHQGRSMEAQAAFPMFVFTAEGIRRGVTKGTMWNPQARETVADGREWDLRDQDVVSAYVFNPQTDQPLNVQERRPSNSIWEPTVIPIESEALNLVVTTYQKLREGEGPIKFKP